MSYAALEWAFRQDLETISKFVLVVLADAANREGVCWPRIATIARKTGVSTRTVQRALRLKARRGLISIEERYRPDGSRSSNRYRLHLDRGVSVSPPPDGRDTTPCHRSQGPPDTSVMSRTTRGTNNEPPLLQDLVEKQSTDRGGGDVFDLVYPGALLLEERAEAEAMLAVLQPPLDQLVLDEWAGIIAAGCDSGLTCSGACANWSSAPAKALLPRSEPCALPGHARRGSAWRPFERTSNGRNCRWPTRTIRW